MVNTRARRDHVDGLNASLTASEIRRPENQQRQEPIPTQQEMFDQIQALQERLRRNEEELENVRMERTTRISRSEGSESNYDSRSRHSRSRSRSRASRTRSRSPTPSAKSDRRVADRRATRDGRVVDYKTFLNCKPTEFKGGYDPVVNLRWLREMEVVFESFDCPEEKKVIFASRMLKESALDWWDTTKDALGRTYVAGMTWESFRELFKKDYCTDRDQRLLEKEFNDLEMGDRTIHEYARLFMEKLRFCGHLCRGEADRIHKYASGLPSEYRGFVRKMTTLAAAIEESKMVDDDLRPKNKKDGNVGKLDQKRKWDGSSGSNKRSEGNSGKFKDDKKVSDWCVSCKSKHSGPCSAATLRCNKCGNTGHLIKDCTDVSRCYNCKEAGHRVADCPKKKFGDKGNDDSKVKARAFCMTADEA